MGVNLSVGIRPQRGIFRETNRRYSVSGANPRIAFERMLAEERSHQLLISKAD